MSHYNIPEEKVKVFQNVIAPKDWTVDFTFPDMGSHFVTFPGEGNLSKGLNILSKPLVWYPKSPDAHFIIAGAGDLLPQINKRVAQLDMCSGFHYTGFISTRGLIRSGH